MACHKMRAFLHFLVTGIRVLHLRRCWLGLNPTCRNEPTTLVHSCCEQSMTTSQALTEPSEPNGRLSCTLIHDGGRWQTHVTSCELIAMDGGNSDPSASLWRLRKGTPLTMRRTPAGFHASSEVLLQSQHVLASGSQPSNVDMSGSPGSLDAKGQAACRSGGLRQSWIDVLLVGKPSGTSGVLEV